MPASRKKSDANRVVDALNSEDKAAHSRDGRSATPVPAVKGHMRGNGVVVHPHKKVKSKHRKLKRGTRASTRTAVANIRAQLGHGLCDDDDEDDDEDASEDEHETPEDRDFIDNSQAEGDGGQSDGTYEPSHSEDDDEEEEENKEEEESMETESDNGAFYNYTLFSLK